MEGRHFSSPSAGVAFVGPPIWKQGRVLRLPAWGVFGCTPSMVFKGFSPRTPFFPAPQWACGVGTWDGDVATPRPRSLAGCCRWGWELGLACFPAVSRTGKGRQSRDVIREGGGVPVEIPSPDRKTMRLAVPKGERAFGGGRGAGRGGKQTQKALVWELK